MKLDDETGAPKRRCCVRPPGADLSGVLSPPLHVAARRQDPERLPKTGPVGLGAGRSVSGGILPARANARVAQEPPLRSAMVTVPAASASATQRSAAASKARRQASRQKRCALPPSRRGSKLLPHHGHAPAVEFSCMLLPVAAHCDERLLSEPTAVAHPCLREPLFMPQNGHSRPSQTKQLGRMKSRP